MSREHSGNVPAACNLQTVDETDVICSTYGNCSGVVDRMLLGRSGLLSADGRQELRLLRIP